MNRFDRVLTAVTVIGVLIFWSSLARSEEADDDTTAVDRFKLTWESLMEGNDSQLSLGSKFTMIIDPGYGWLATSNANVERRKYRVRDTEEIVESLSGSAAKIKPELYIFNFSVGETYMKKKLVGLARYGKDLIVNNETASFDFVLEKPFLMAKSSQISITGNASRGLNDFKYDRSISGSIGSFLRYEFGDLLGVRGGAGTNVKREGSEIGQTIEFSGMPSRMDSMRADIDLGRGEEKLLELTFRRNEGVVRKVSPPRGNSLEILDDPESAKEEEERTKNQSLTMGSFVQLLPDISVNLSFEHNQKKQKNRVDKRLSRESENTKISATTKYGYSEKGYLSFVVENSESDMDYGPVSLGSYSKKSKKASVSMSHRVLDSLSVSIRGSTSLMQMFMKKRDANPRDKDELVYVASARMKAVPFSRVRTDVGFEMNRWETINIDKTLSGDNRVDYTYMFTPGIIVEPARWVRLTQDYVLKFEYTEFVHDENNNTLDRTTSVETGARFQVLAPLSFTFSHNFRKRDAGSYLWRGGKRRYGRQGENIENGLVLNLRYRPSEDFVVKAATDFRNQESNRLAVKDGRSVVVSTNLYETGGLKVGFERIRKFGDRGELNLDVVYVRRFGPNITEARREYWVINAGIEFTF